MVQRRDNPEYWTEEDLQRYFSSEELSRLIITPVKLDSKEEPVITRSLRTTIKNYKKNLDAIASNPSAYTHGWLLEAMLYYQDNQYDRWSRMPMIKRPEDERIEFPTAKYRKKFLRVLSKGIGEPIVQIRKDGRYIFVPAKLTKSYWHYEVFNGSISQLYVDGEEFDRLKRTNMIKWCPVLKHWAKTGAFVFVKYYNGTKYLRTVHQTLFPHRKEYKICRVCTTTYKGATVFNRKSKQLTCPSCATKPVENPPLTQTRVITQYHSHSDWLFLPQYIKNEDEIPLGMELEIHSRHGNNKASASKSAWQIYTAQKAINDKWNNFYFEWDGSLTDGGFEMITNPMTLSVHKQFWPVLLPHMRQVTVGWNVGNLIGAVDVSYGTHITFHREHVTDSQLARLINFHSNKNNGTFLGIIAQRFKGYRTGDFTTANATFRDLTNRKANGTINYGETKYTNIYVKDVDLIEFRLFRSTLNTESFLKNIEYVAAMLQWIKSTPYSKEYEDFLTWLSSNTARTLRYPNLMGYLHRPTITVHKTHTVATTALQQVIKSVGYIHDKKVILPTNPSNDTRYSEDLECA